MTFTPDPPGVFVGGRYAGNQDMLRIFADAATKAGKKVMWATLADIENAEGWMATDWEAIRDELALLHEAAEACRQPRVIEDE